VDCQEKAMNVLVIVPDVGRYGGTSRFLERLLDIHARKSITTTILVPTSQCHSGLFSLADQYSAELLQSSCLTDSGTSPLLTPFYDLLFSWRTVLAKRFDLIVVSTGEPGRLSVSLYFPLPVLYILHSIPEHRFRLLPRMYLWLGSMLGNCVMAVSSAAAESVATFMGIPESRVETVYNSCGTAANRNVADMMIVLTVGHLAPYKNPARWFEVACSVLQKYPETLFVWLGDGEQLDTLRQKVRDTCWQEQILLPGYESEPSSWYARAKIYFQPSLRENHSIAVLEAMSHSLPCVVANTGGLPESVVDGETGYVCSPDNSPEYAARIIELISNAVLRDRMGAAGCQRIQNCFSEDIQERKIIAIYNRLTKNESLP
jgi:glycosyltransferase involved in cell wall biosynthesis